MILEPIWSRNQKQQSSAVGKVSYLKELLNPKVRAPVDGLPFTIEGYKRVKNILTLKLIKQSEAVDTPIQTIMNLAMINHYNSKIFTASMKNWQVAWNYEIFERDKWVRKTHPR